MKRIIFHSFKAIIGTFVYIDSRLYMKMYNRLLNYSGIRLTGTPRFIAKSVKFDDFNLITIGDRFVASMNVHFLTHDYSYTTAMIAIGDTPATDIGILREIIVGNNVFIGMNSILLPGTIIGNNVVIGAGSVVRGIIEDNVVVSGNPAKVIGTIEDFASKLKSRKTNLIIDKN